MPMDPDELLKQASGLPRDELLKLADRLLAQAHRAGATTSCAITDLKGLGKELWQGVDPDEYVANERDSWEH